MIIIGIGTTAEQAYTFIKEYELFNVVGFAVDALYKKQETFLDKPLFAVEDLDRIMDKENDLLFVAILWNRLNADRKDIFLRLKAQGFKFANLISPTAKIRGKLLGTNCWFHDYSIVQPNAKINENTAVMAFSLIGAFAVLGSHCFLGAKSVIGGNCTLGEQCFIGINSIIFDDRRIGNKCIIGACTAVKRDMPDFSSIKTETEAIVIKIYSDSEVENKLLFSKNQH